MKLNPVFVLRKIYNIYLLVPIRKNNIANEAIALNDTAALIFQNCEQSKTSHELACTVASYFIDNTESEIVEILEPYINDLIKENYLLL